MLLTWKCSFMEFNNWLGTLPAFHCNLFASSVLFNLLLELKKESLSMHTLYTSTRLSWTDERKLTDGVKKTLCYTEDFKIKG